jgi:myosin protein heavy chain
MIQKKEEQITQLTRELDLSKSIHAKSLKETIELQNDIDILMAELDAEKSDRVQEGTIRTKLQEEVDRLRSLMDAKTSEESRRNEVEKRKEGELTDLRTQTSKLQQDLADSRRLALEVQNKLKIELEHSMRDHDTLQRSHESLSERERAAQDQLTRSLGALSELEKTKRAMESELQSLRSRQHDNESRLAEATKAKEVRSRMYRSYQTFIFV